MHLPLIATTDGIAAYCAAPLAAASPAVAGPPNPGYGATCLSGPTGVAFRADGNVYVANSITEYAAGANGDVSPVATISGPATGLDAPGSLPLADGQIWVTHPAALGCICHSREVAGRHRRVTIHG